MKKHESAYLLCVVLAAVFFVALSFSQLGHFFFDGAAGPGVSGRAREVDMIKIRRLIKRGRLSDHEAEFYQPAEKQPEPLSKRAPLLDMEIKTPIESP